MQQHSHYDVVIMGGAAIGSAAAYFLTSHPGFKGTVLVIEKDFSYQYCATALSAASIRHQFSTPENIMMSQFGTEFLRNFSTHLAVNGEQPDAAFHEGGYLFLATQSGMATLQENHQTQRSLGVDVTLLDPISLQARYPWMNTDDLAGGSLGLSGEGWLDAYGLMQGMRKKAMAQGANWLQGQVLELHRDLHRISGITLADGTRIDCDYVINAAGTGATQLANQVGIHLPIESRKRCVFYLQCPDSLPNCPMVIDPSGAYFRPEGQGFIAGIAPNANDDPESYDFNVHPTLFEEVLWPLLAARVPAFEALRCTRSWAGHYDMNTVDQNLIIGLHPDVNNLFFANGFSGHGMQQSPAVGRALSELIVDGSYQTLDLSRMGWQRILNGQPLTEKNIV
ncbi:MAG: FAD-binding oxidoreductase [Burkholderiaceae bacterium]|nr:FAD-binding oxidoreductase [Burkholderiaceae bacterium]